MICCNCTLVHFELPVTQYVVIEMEKQREEMSYRIDNNCQRTSREKRKERFLERTRQTNR